MEFRPMRRVRQQLTNETCLEILRNATSGTLAVLGDADYPYAVPLSFVYTDGVPEAERSDRKQFGLERTVTMLRRIEDLPPQSIVTGMSSAVYDFVGEVPQFDDLTMLVLHYKGRPSDGQS